MTFDLSVVPPLWPALLRGALVTLQLTVIVLIIATPLGVLVALARNAPNRAVRLMTLALSGIFRGIPPLLILFFAFFALPFLGLRMNPMPSAIIAMSSYMAFYFAEAFTAGLNSVAHGQWQAARALGLSPIRTLTRIVLPQTIPAALPPYISHATEILKGTALAGAVAVPELSLAARQIFVVNFRPLEVLLAAAAIYAVLDAVLLALQMAGERWSARRRVRA